MHAYIRAFNGGRFILFLFPSATLIMGHFQLLTTWVGPRDRPPVLSLLPSVSVPQARGVH